MRYQPRQSTLSLLRVANPLMQIAATATTKITAAGITLLNKNINTKLIGKRINAN